MNHKVLVLVTCVLTCIAAATSHADPTFSFSGGTRAGEATFGLDGNGDLTILLENTSQFDTTIPTELLTGVYFRIAGFTGELTRLGVFLTDLSDDSNDPNDDPVLFAVPGPNNHVLGYEESPAGRVGGEWGYRNGMSGVPGGADQVVAAVGLEDLLGGDHIFPGDNLSGNDPPNGMAYGMVSEGNVYNSGNTAVTGDNPLINSDVLITLGGLPTGFQLSDIGAVMFNYGTDFSPIPAPGAVVLAVMGFGMIGWVKRRCA